MAPERSRLLTNSAGPPLANIRPTSAARPIQNHAIKRRSAGSFASAVMSPGALSSCGRPTDIPRSSANRLRFTIAVARTSEPWGSRLGSIAYTRQGTVNSGNQLAAITAAPVRHPRSRAPPLRASTAIPRTWTTQSAMAASRPEPPAATTAPDTAAMSAATASARELERTAHAGETRRRGYGAGLSAAVAPLRRVRRSSAVASSSETSSSCQRRPSRTRVNVVGCSNAGLLAPGLERFEDYADGCAAIAMLRAHDTRAAEQFADLVDGGVEPGAADAPQDASAVRTARAQGITELHRLRPRQHRMLGRGFGICGEVARVEQIPRRVRRGSRGRFRRGGRGLGIVAGRCGHQACDEAYGHEQPAELRHRRSIATAPRCTGRAGRAP